jgi:sporulation integral membrane protein YlbJ
MGLASGYPMDAVITSKFRKNQLCTSVEAERLLSFTNTADPLFMFGAVAVGMFGMPELGATIALAHYLSSFLVGVIFRFHRHRQNNDSSDAARPPGNILIRAFRALYNARQEDKRSPGQLLGDSVKSSMNTIILIGGFIIVFSVLIRIIEIVGITHILTAAFASLLNLIGFSTSLAPALVSGLLEIDLGALAASQSTAPLIEKVAITGAIIAWSGLSVHGQVASIVIESGIRMTPYMFGRLLHAILATIITLLLMGPAQNLTKIIIMPVVLMPGNGYSITFWLARFEQIGYQIALFTVLLLSISLIVHLARGIRLYGKK